MHKRVGYLVEQIALILLALAIGSTLYPHIQSIWLNNYSQPNLWGAIVMEFQIAWPVFLIAAALIMAMVAILWRHDETKDTERIEGLLRLICIKLGVDLKVWDEEQQKNHGKTKRLDTMEAKIDGKQD